MSFRVVQAFQFTVSDLLYFCVVGGADAERMKDEHGEVCPANWREGGKTSRGDPIAKLDYFAAVDGQHECDWYEVYARRLAKAYMHVRGG